MQHHPLFKYLSDEDKKRVANEYAKWSIALMEQALKKAEDENTPEDERKFAIALMETIAERR